MWSTSDPDILFLMLSVWFVLAVNLHSSPASSDSSTCSAKEAVSPSVPCIAKTSVLTLTLPVPLGVIIIFPFVFVEEIVLPLTLILRPFNFETLATVTFDLSNQAQIIESSIPSISIISLVVIPIIYLNRRIGMT